MIRRPFLYGESRRSDAAGIALAAALPSLTRLAALLALLRVLRVLGLAALLLLLARRLALLVVLLLLRITVLFGHRASPSVHSALVTHGKKTGAES
ncbi:MAG: hypothetical protein KAG62_05580 [Caulobacter sp.]|nr:hypothetical protein [Caulobacter sp.]